MVVFVDYDRHSHDSLPPGQVCADPLQRCCEESVPLASRTVAGEFNDVTCGAQPQPSDHGQSNNGATDMAPSSTEREKKANNNVNAFSTALSCYPIVKELARSVDLNTLDALSRTCRQIRANLLPYRRQLIKETLRCENEYVETLNELLREGTPVPDSLKRIVQLISQDTSRPGRLTSSKIGKCARDMVTECRRCSRVVCRNCMIKPPTKAVLKNRLRRLCKTCQTVPLIYHMYPKGKAIVTEPASFTHSAFARTPCHCEEAVWLCQSCGQSLRNNDTMYRRVWTWRTRYSTYLGGNLGTGIGEGCQGVKCGRGEDCLAAQEIELEVDCEADASTNGTFKPSHNHHGNDDYSAGENRILRQHGSLNGHMDSVIDHHGDDEPGYLRQEIVGIGGVVKQKAKKRVTVGACVVEHEDEREHGQYLLPEERGQCRSWCAWCWRVVPSQREKAAIDARTGQGVHE